MKKKERRKNLEYLRLYHNLSQEELANKINMSREFMSNIESGSKNPSLKTAIQLSRALGITLCEELFEMSEEIDFEFIDRVTRDFKIRKKDKKSAN